MKKLVSLVLALILVFSMAVAAQAETIVATDETKSVDVKAQYTGGISTPTVYSVDVSWGAMAFTYNASGTLDWNVNSHEYENNTEATWTASENTVTVTNHSNAEVAVSMVYTALEGYSAVTGTIENSSFTLPSAVGKEINDAELSGTATLTLSGELDSTVTTLTKVGTITVTIA